MKTRFLHLFFSFCLPALLWAGCTQISKKDKDDENRNEEAGIPTGDAQVTSLVRKGVVAARVVTKKVKDQSSDYRFYPDDDISNALELTTASPDEGKGFVEEKKIDLTPYANKYIEIRGSSFAKRYVFNAEVLRVANSAQDSLQCRYDPRAAQRPGKARKHSRQSP